MPSDSDRSHGQGGLTGVMTRVLSCLVVCMALHPLVGRANPSSPLDTPASPATPATPCQKPVYLTFDTGHMGVAPLIAEVLQRHQVKVTFFAAHEPTQTGDGSLGTHWAPWWQARAREGHAFASHTHDHVYWLADA
ncbi:MAG: hypothetical protein RLZZ395_2072, partial [Pseudomonadota bacterium]